MIYFSSLLENDKYQPAAEKLFAALNRCHSKYTLLPGTKDIWMRDFMPVRRKDGIYLSFCYNPSYLEEYPNQRTVFQDIAEQFPFSVEYSDINLDGGNLVFSPSKERVIISDRIFSENPGYAQGELVRELEHLLMAEVIIIPSLKSDMTGHADGMVRFIDENRVIGNNTPYKNGLEQRVAKVLAGNGIITTPFPYYDSPQISAAGCYLNFLETETHIFLPVFGDDMDRSAQEMTERLFGKETVPVRIDEIAAEGGCLNCISWEN